MTRFWSWIIFALGAVYFALPLIGTLEFSLRMRRGEYSFDAYRKVFADPQFQARQAIVSVPDAELGSVRMQGVGPRVREGMRRLACTLARWPRPKRERLPDVTRPDRETPPPAFFAAASACAMKGRVCCARVERMRPGRMRNSCSSDMAHPRTVQNRE